MAESDAQRSDSPPARPSKEPLETIVIVDEDKPKETTDSTTKTDLSPSSVTKDPAASGSNEKHSKPSYSDVLAGSEDGDMAPAPPPRTKSKGKGTSERDFDRSDEKDGDSSMLMDLDPAGSVSLLDVSTMELFGDAVAYQSAPGRTSSLLPTTEEDEPDDEYLPAGYEKASFTARRKREDPKMELQEENMRLRRHVNDLSKKNANLITEKQIAEEKADRAAERVAEMKASMSSGMTDIERTTDSLLQELQKAKEENHALREQIKDAQAHIFSLQPYRKDLTAEEIGRVSRDDRLDEHASIANVA